MSVHPSVFSEPFHAYNNSMKPKKKEKKKGTFWRSRDRTLVIPTQVELGMLFDLLKIYRGLDFS